MKCDLERIFGELAAQLPTSFSGNDCNTFTSRDLPVPLVRLLSDRLYIHKRAHQYHEYYSYQVDSLYFFAHKETYQHLGLLMLAVLFHPQPSEVVIELIHPASDIKNLILVYEHGDLEHLPGGYHTRPYGFVYFPTETSKHPFDEGIPPRDLPRFGLTKMDGFVDTEEDFRNRDTVKICGKDVGQALFAELLLNAGQPENPVDEYELEGEGGFRGVGVWSAEVRLFLPGHELAWDDDEWRTE